MTARILRASGIVTVISLAGLGAGFLLKMLLAARFGAGSDSDALLAAMTLPTLAATVFMTAMNITFIPVFIEYESKSGPEEAWRVASSFIVLVVISLSVLSLLAFVFSGQLIGLIAPGLDAETEALAAELQRILLPSAVLLVWGSLLGGLFYAQHSYALPSLGPLVSNLVAVGVAWLLVDLAGIHSLAIGVLVGAAAQLLFLLGSLFIKYRVPIQLDLRHPGVRQIGRLIVPWLLGAMIYKANPIVDRIIASNFHAGAISVLGYAALLAQIATFASARGASLAVFPTMSRFLNTGQREKLPGLIDLGLRIIISFLVPLLVLILLEGETIVTLVLRRGAFSAEDAHQTGLALIAFAGSIVALSFGNVVNYVFYALQDTKTPAFIAAAGMGLNLTLALLLQRWLGFYAPAVSYSFVTLLTFAVLSRILRRRLGGVLVEGFWAFCLKTAAAGAGMALTMALIRPSFLTASPLIHLLAVSAGGIPVYLLLWAYGNRTLVGRLFRRAEVSA